MIEKETIQLLGRAGKDKVTGFIGIITSVSFDLYGCICVVLHPPMKDGNVPDGKWYDVQRIECLPDDRVMPVPKFSAMATEPADYTHGAADKPLPR